MAVKGTVRSVLSLEVLGSRRNTAGKVCLPEYPIGPIHEEGLDRGCHVHSTRVHDGTATGTWLGRVYMRS